MLIPFFVTGGIHLDGMLDTADALSSWRPMERRIEILKDSHAGAFAILICVVYFFLLYAVTDMVTCGYASGICDAVCRVALPEAVCLS